MKETTVKYQSKFIPSYSPENGKKIEESWETLATAGFNIEEKSAIMNVKKENIDEEDGKSDLHIESETRDLVLLVTEIKEDFDQQVEDNLGVDLKEDIKEETIDPLDMDVIFQDNHYEFNRVQTNTVQTSTNLQYNQSSSTDTREECYKM